MANVTVIPATRNIHTGIRKDAVTKRKTAGYARVSTDSEEQLTSYEAQVDYYTSYIQSRPEWEFVKVYTDEGISATDTRHRDGFNEMIKDALDGKIDLIVTKSVSRFARNTVDSLSTVRKLKERGVEVYFQKENIFTFDSKGELLITIMSSLAQEESRSISENVTWGKRKRFADGKVSLAYFGSKVWHSNSKYKRTVWQCNAKFKGEHKCTTPHLYEQRIQELFLEALSSLMENRDSLIDDCRAVMHVLGDCKAIDREMEEVRSEMEVTTGLIQKLIDENATRKMDQNDYRKRYDGYVSRYAALESRMDSLEKERKEREFKYDIFSGFLFELGEIHELPLAFDDRLFYQLIDYATVYSDGRVVFTFRNGTEITTEM